MHIIAIAAVIQFSLIAAVAIFLLTEKARARLFASLATRKKNRSQIDASSFKKKINTPIDFDDPDLIAAVKELNDFLPGPDLDIQEWRKECEQLPQPKARDTTRDGTAALEKIRDSIIAQNKKGSSSYPGSYTVSYKGVQIERPSAPSANTTEAEFRRYAEQLGFDFVGWTREDSLAAHSAAYFFTVQNPITRQYHKLCVRVHQPPVTDSLEAIPRAFFEAYKSALEKLINAEKSKLAQNLMVPEGLLSVTQTSANETQYLVNTEILNRMKSSKGNREEDCSLAFGEFSPSSMFDILSTTKKG